MSKKLATIEQNVPVELNETALDHSEVPDQEKLKALFDELEFRTVAARILSEIDKSEKPRSRNSFLPRQQVSHFRALFSEMNQSSRWLRKRQ